MHVSNYRVTKVSHKRIEQWVVRHKEDDFRQPASSWIGNQTALETQRTYCYQLLDYLNWADETNFDLESNLSKGQIMTITEIGSLTNYIATNKADLAPTTFGAKLITISAYLQWETDRFRRGKHSTSPLKTVLKDEVERFKELIENQITKYEKSNPRRAKRTKRVGEKGLKSDEITRLELLLNPVSIEKECEALWGKHARRNWLIVSFFYFYGMRASELLQLKTTTGDNGTFRENQIAIEPDDTPHKDPRKHKPGFKTYSRVLPMDDTLYQQVSAYIMNERRAVSKKPALTHSQYLFITREGPISANTINAIVGQFLKVLVKAELSNPHCLRHTCAANFVRRLIDIFPKDTKPDVREAQVTRLLSYWFGWSSGGGFGSTSFTPTALLYTEMATQERISEVSLAHQKKVMTELLIEDVPF